MIAGKHFHFNVQCNLGIYYDGKMLVNVSTALPVRQ